MNVSYVFIRLELFPILSVFLPEGMRQEEISFLDLLSASFTLLYCVVQFSTAMATTTRILTSLCVLPQT